MELISILKEICRKTNIKCYIVGGFIRDFFLGVKNYDIDITIEGNGIEFAKVLNKYINGILRVYNKFKTASITAENYIIDIASARCEYYKYPAALPVVKFSDIKEDIARRDFTINMLAYDVLNDAIIDYYNGLKDLQNKVIRVINDKSFIDDPTRIFRALRYSGRYGFKIDDKTDILIKKAVNGGFIKKLSNDRIINEIFLFLQEDKIDLIIESMISYGIQKEIFDNIKLNIKKINSTINNGDIILYRFLLLFYNIDDKGIKYLLNRYNLRRKYIEALKELVLTKNNLCFLKDNCDNIYIYNTFKNIKYEVLMAINISEDISIKKIINHYINHLSHIKLTVNGNDIKNAGLNPGPVYSIILEKIFNAKLQGKIKNHDEELNLLKIYVNKVKKGELI
jgi:poly(A) polymerase/tRNA nucleotidyltransferase (CCA-adding enzyme)